MSVKIRWLGHSFVELTTAGGKVVLFDPWTKDEGNPTCPLGTDQQIRRVAAQGPETDRSGTCQHDTRKQMNGPFFGIDTHGILS